MRPNQNCRVPAAATADPRRIGRLTDEPPNTPDKVDEKKYKASTTTDTACALPSGKKHTATPNATTLQTIPTSGIAFTGAPAGV